MSDELRRLAANLKELPNEANRTFRAGLRSAVDPVVSEAKTRSGWSDRIPGAIGTRTRVTGRGVSVAVRVNAKKAPHARAIEHKGKPGNFRKPVFADASKPRGEWTWAPQRAAPFLRPAAEAKIDEAAGRMMDTVTAAIRRSGWR